MHKEILNQNQIALLPLISSFKRAYYLVGGTAIALYIGHRRSVDFDLFKHSKLNHKRNLDKVTKYKFPFTVTRRVAEQMNLTVNDVKVTFFEYPFEIPAVTSFENYIKLPSLLDLAAMKAFALGRRSKWKDYVDLYFIITRFFSIKEIAGEAEKIFTSQFSEKLFRAQLAFHKDIDYSEEVEYVIPNPPTPDEIRNGLIEKAADFF